MNDLQYKEFEKAAKPLIEFLANYHPHVKAIVDCNSAELVEGLAMVNYDMTDSAPDKTTSLA